MEPWIQSILTIGASVAASSGFWAYFTKRADRHSATTQLLLGMAHDRIVTLGMKYIRRGWIYKDEFADFTKYLYDPYAHFGGNGLADKVMSEIKKLPLYKDAKLGDVNSDEDDI